MPMPLYGLDLEFASEEWFKPIRTFRLAGWDDKTYPAGLLGRCTLETEIPS